MEVSEILELIKIGISFILTFVPTIIFIVKAIKNKKWNELVDKIEKEIVPLMEQAEGFFAKAEDKENWVLSRLAEKLHIDFYKYKNILAVAKSIIANICKLTKTNVNKIVIFENKKEETKQEQKGTYTNGVA